MTSEPIRDPFIDHLLTPQNSALVVVDYQPFQIEVVGSMDRELLVQNIVSVARTATTYVAGCSASCRTRFRSTGLPRVSPASRLA